MSYQIILPAGLEVIETWEIPYLLTQGRHPDVPRAGVSSAEILGKSDSDATVISEFTDSDRDLLDHIWQDREDWRTGIPLHVLADYLAAFNAHPERPVWNLSWIPSGGKHLETQAQFDEGMRRDIADGTLSVRYEASRRIIPPECLMQDAHKTTVVLVEDFMVYAKRFVVDVQVTDPAAASGPDVFDRSDQQLPTGTVKKGRKKRQIEAIVECAKKLGFPPLAIPRGGKRDIQDICLEDKELFTQEAFLDAWKRATQETPPCIRMKDHEMFSRR